MAIYRRLGDRGLNRGRRRDVCRVSDHGDGFDDVEAGAAQQLVDDGAGEAAGVVLDTDGLGRLVEFHAADTVDVADLGEREHGAFGGRNAISVEDVELSHELILSAGYAEA